MKRVVVTGMGALTALGATVESTFDRLIQGHSGIVSHPSFALPVAVGYVDIDVTKHFSKMQLMGLDRVSQLAIIAAEQAMHQASATGDALEALRRQVLPPTSLISQPDSGVTIDFVTHAGKPKTNLNYGMSNSFAFGGNDTVLIARGLAKTDLLHQPGVGQSRLTGLEYSSPH